MQDAEEAPATRDVSSGVVTALRRLPSLDLPGRRGLALAAVVVLALLLQLGMVSWLDWTALCILCIIPAARAAPAALRYIATQSQLGPPCPGTRLQESLLETPGLRSSAAAAAVMWQPAMACALSPRCLTQAVGQPAMRAAAASQEWAASTARRAQAAVSAAVQVMQAQALPAELRALRPAQPPGKTKQGWRLRPASVGAAVGAAPAKMQAATLRLGLEAAKAEVSSLKRQLADVQAELQQAGAAASDEAARLRRAVAAAEEQGGELRKALAATNSSVAAAQTALAASRREAAEARQQLVRTEQAAEAAAIAAASRDTTAAAATEDLRKQLAEASRRAERLAAEVQDETKLRQHAAAASAETGETGTDTAVH